jgi:RimJ/RimL family protein N-acetyltransferase
MSEYYNHLGQPIGFPMLEWQARPWPPRTIMAGNYCQLEPLNPDSHAADLYEAYTADKDGRNWTYLFVGPFETFTTYREWLEAACLGDDPLFHAIISAKTGKAVGVATYLRIEPKVGVIEVGHINYSPQLQKTAAATEAMFLMMCRVFDELGYRRYEWKCDALNAPSRNAALRLGFTFEGIFRQATLYKGRNRDTAWFSMLDREWPALKQAYTTWLAPDNFDADGRQRQRLPDLISRASSPTNK